MRRARGFPAFGRMQRRLGPVAQTWWGREWTRVLEEKSGLDAEQLKAGRKIAYTGTVGPITLSPGRISAEVREGHDFYETYVAITPFEDREWGWLLEEFANRSGYLAALLDHEMPQDLATSAAGIGVPLFPTTGGVDTECDCDDWHSLGCRHAAALVYQAAWLLDADPFLLFLLLGKDEEELLLELQFRTVAHVRRPAARGSSIADAYARTPGPLPDIPVEVPREPAPRLDVSSPPGLPPELLPQLYANAVWHARHLLADSANAEPEPRLDMNEDLARVIAQNFNVEIARKIPPLRDAAMAWFYGGREGYAIAHDKWAPSELELARARIALEAAELGEFTAETDREGPTNWFTFTEPRIQLRLGRDGRWYPFTMGKGDWVAAGPPDRDPAMAFAVPPPLKIKRPRKRVPDC
ncbi:SWF/SNF family helicase [Allokutzneria sp. A3M-2-11 16]|uniref:SWIM zinc finger family protein n=1 Tax=Allokutzneria sp. A3M-2-11 16 TaxID=2962043 RepID=UPI0020B854DB|nr:SWIM zinc finger family protein [Allokutzneria sp. A3M-2-11 16]MCP3802967.1 SWF/SNF family helicase [Allokutzneria sp. A3M-2-11 16]